MSHDIFPRWRFAMGFVLVLSCLPYADASQPFGFLGSFFLSLALSLVVCYAKLYLSHTIRTVIAMVVAIALGVVLLLSPMGYGTMSLWLTLALLAVALWLVWQGNYALHLLAVPVAWVVGITLIVSLVFASNLPHIGIDFVITPRLSAFFHLLILPLYLVQPLEKKHASAFCTGSLVGALVAFALLLHTATLLGTSTPFLQPLSTMFSLLPLFGMLEHAGAVFEALLTACVVVRLAVILTFLPRYTDVNS